MSEFKFYIAGVKFHQAKSVLHEIQVGNELNIEPEPTNKYDPNAVKLLFDSESFEAGIMLGYVPKKFSAEVAALDEVMGLTCTVTEVNPKAPTWEQIKVVIEEIE